MHRSKKAANKPEEAKQQIGSKASKKGGTKRPPPQIDDNIAISNGKKQNCKVTKERNFALKLHGQQRLGAYDPQPAMVLRIRSKQEAKAAKTKEWAKTKRSKATMTKD